MSSDIKLRSFDIFNVTDKLNLLFHNTDAVLQRAGFSVAAKDRKLPDYFVDKYDSYEKAVDELCRFVEQLNTSNIEKARHDLLIFLHIKNDGSDIFSIPTSPNQLQKVSKL
jgi:hypothetical protein